MTTTHAPPTVRRSTTTVDGEISYLERGVGPTALFIHGVMMNGHLWDATIEPLSSDRRCIAVDLMGHGETRVGADQELSLAAQAAMLGRLLDALGEERVDLVANDSGGAIAQIFAATTPERVRSLTLTNCDTHDNLFPPAVVPLFELIRAGNLLDVVRPMSTDVLRARAFFASALERPRDLSEEVIRRFVEPLIRNEEADRSVQRWMEAFTPADLLAVEPLLAGITAPTLIVWATGDVFFDVSWAYWLQRRIPGAIDVVEVPGARLFLPLERPTFLAGQIQRVWSIA
jgi:pimeloyl-ACP methyl ester carboxylesterase